MNVENDLALAYHMGYDDALAKRKPDASKAQVLAPYELVAENAKLRELVRDYHTFLALAELAQPIGHIVAAHGHPTLSIAALDERYRELGVEVDE